MSITSADILNAHQQLLAETQQPHVAQTLEQIQVQQKYEEEQLATRTTTCDVPMLSALRDQIPGLQANELKNITIREFYNPAAMQATMCAVDSLFYSSPSDLGSLYLNNRIRLYIQNLRQIGSESVEGYAMLGDFEKAKDLFVVKVSRSPTDDALLHELIIGVFGTNRLRQYIPNFSYIYGGFKCSPPLIDPESKKVVTWCLHNDNAVNYVLYENITPAVSVAKYIQTCTGKQFLNVYMQIVYALRLGHPIVDFTHYDLHYENILVRSLPNIKGDFQIVYETERGLEYFTTQGIATIIDYGFSHIKVPETQQHVGRSGFVAYSVYPERSWIMHDLYKFLMFSMLAAKNANNNEVFTEASKIFRYFNKIEDPAAALTAQQTVLYALPITDITDKFTIDDLARYIRSVCDCDFILPQQSAAPVLDCERLCPTENAILTRIGMTPGASIGTPDNILEFYDIITRLQTAGREQERVQISTSFKYEQAMTAHIRKMQAFVRDLTNFRRQLKLMDVSTLGTHELLNYNTMMVVRSTYVTMGAIVDRLVDLQYYYDIGKAVAEAYQDQASIKALDNIMNGVDRNLRPGIEEAKQVLARNHQHLNQVTPDETVLANDPRLRWYWEGRRLFDIVLGLQ